MSAPYFSLVMATYGRSDELARLIDSLAMQTERSFELIIADQNPDDRVLPYVALARSHGWPCTHLRLSTANLSAARNAGMQLAAGQWLAFPDDDCWYEPDTLAQVRDCALRCPEAAGVVARWSEQAENGSPRPTRQEERLTLGAWRRFRGGQASSISLFVRLSLASQIGGFDERLGVGQAFGGAEETDFVLRALQAGTVIVRAPLAAVHHAIGGGAPKSLRQIWQFTLSRSRGTGALYAKHRLAPRIIARGLTAPLVRALARPTGLAGLVGAVGQIVGRWQGWRRWPRD